MVEVDPEVEEAPTPQPRRPTPAPPPSSPFTTALTFRDRSIRGLSEQHSVEVTLDPTRYQVHRG